MTRAVALDLNIARIAKLPYGQRKDLLKEMLYCREGPRCPIFSFTNCVYCPRCLHCLYCLYYLHCLHCLHYMHCLHCLHCQYYLYSLHCPNCVYCQHCTYFSFYLCCPQRCILIVCIVLYCVVIEILVNLVKLVKYGRNCELWWQLLVLYGLVWFGMVGRGYAMNVDRGYVMNVSRGYVVQNH